AILRRAPATHAPEADTRASAQAICIREWIPVDSAATSIDVHRSVMKPASPQYHAKLIGDLSLIDATAWDALAAAQPEPTPFLRHAFLHALHDTGCADAASGWSPQYLTLWSGKGDGEQLVAAMPLYAKSHSYGEYVVI